MESDGPYSVKNYKYRWCVDGLDKEHTLNQFRYKKWAEWWASQLNTARAEGRKSMEKEFKELLDLANQAGNFNQDMMQWKIKFEDWKKAQGIENRIRGGQDGE